MEGAALRPRLLNTAAFLSAVVALLYHGWAPFVRLLNPPKRHDRSTSVTP